MSVWLTIPSARPAAEIAERLARWRAKGYKIALWRDDSTPADIELLKPDLVSVGPYPGYANATNALIGSAAIIDPDAGWFVIGGDDVEPAEPAADAIARECTEHFAGECWMCSGHWDPSQWDGSPQCPECHGAGRLIHSPMATYGVMQPTGDSWGDRNGPYIQRVAGSAWLGRTFALYVNGGNGPLWAEYQHMYVDEELQAVAQMLGVFWQRPDLEQKHEHWGRRWDASAEHIPAHLQRWNAPEHWREAKAIFDRRKAAGFPGHERLVTA